MSIRIGGAILGFPFAILIVGIAGWGLSEISFLGTAFIEGYGDSDERDWKGDCIIKDNGIEKICKNEFGLFGWKQWFSQDEVNITENTIAKPIKILESVVTEEPQQNKTNSKVIFEDEFRVCTMDQNQPPVCIWK